MTELWRKEKSTGLFENVKKEKDSFQMISSVTDGGTPTPRDPKFENGFQEQKREMA